MNAGQRLAKRRTERRAKRARELPAGRGPQFAGWLASKRRRIAEIVAEVDRLQADVESHPDDEPRILADNARILELTAEIREIRAKAGVVNAYVGAAIADRRPTTV